ncbi:MAG TPA: ABC transporter substrate-binding protein, partial [Chromatiaceae bacterium]|nr:ABC transporter substrate-binding protein [Chromatiaceae bacterium]
AVLYRQIQGLILADMPYVPLWYEDQFFAARREVRGYQLAPDGNYDALMAVELNREILPRAGVK